MHIYIYIYIHIYIYKLCVFCFVSTHTHTAAHWSLWFHIHIIFPSCFYLIIVTSRNSLPNSEHDPIYQ